MADYFTFDQLHHFPALTPTARLAVIGDPIGHSKSPQMHNPALQACGIDAQYVRVQVPVGHVQEAFGLFVKQGFQGVNITIPHKFEALNAVDVVDPLARQLGAVNTLAIRQGKMHGYNTDGPGFLRSVKEAFGVDVKDLRILILGAGGGAGAAVFTQCLLHGCQELVYSNRSLEKALKLNQTIKALEDVMNVKPQLISRIYWDRHRLAEAASNVDLIVNATAVGMKAEDAPLLPEGTLESRHLVYDMVYRASGPTDLIQQAIDAGAKNADGMCLLLHQGAISFEHWFDLPAPIDVMRAGLLNA